MTASIAWSSCSPAGGVTGSCGVIFNRPFSILPPSSWPRFNLRSTPLSRWFKRLRRCANQTRPSIGNAFHRKALEIPVYKDGKPKCRIYETALVARLRGRPRAGDAWVKGRRDYRRFDAYLVPKVEAKSIMGETVLLHS